MKRITALILALLLVISCFAFAGCGDDGKKENEKKPDDKKEQNDDEDDGDDERDKPEYDIQISDEPIDIDFDEAKQLYEGTAFVIDTPSPWGKDRFVREDYNDDPLNDSIRDMNLAVLDKIGVELQATMSTTTDKQMTAFVDSVQAGDHKFDVMAIHTQSNCATLVIQDAVLDFDSLENVDLTKPWWNKTFTDSTAILGVNYFGVSSSCYAIYLNTVALLFNKKLAEEHNLPDFYDLVRKDKWTIDELIKATKNFSHDDNQDGYYDYEDTLAMVSDDGPHINAWLGAFRQSTVQKGENDEPEIVVNSARMSTIVDKLNELYNKGKRTVVYKIYEREFGDDMYNKAFAEGRVLFDVAYIDVATKLREYDVDFGILPMPKLNLEQEKYGSYVEAWHLCYAVPKNLFAEADRISTVLETMAYYSYHNTYPAIIQQVIYGAGTRDSESSEMLDIIYQNMTWDFGYVYHGHDKGYATILSSIVGKDKADQLSSYIAEKKNEVETHFSDLYDAATSNASRS